jgi:hypothetical protein
MRNLSYRNLEHLDFCRVTTRVTASSTSASPSFLSLSMLHGSLPLVSHPFLDSYIAKICALSFLVFLVLIHEELNTSRMQQLDATLSILFM